MIGIAGSQARVRHGLRILLEQQAGWTVAWEDASGQELWKSLGASCPDLVLIDWDLPGPAGEDLLRCLRGCFPELLVLSLGGKKELGPLAIQSGGDAFVWKAESPLRMLDLIRALGDCNSLIKR